MFKYSELDITAVKPVVGANSLERCKDITKLLNISNTPIMLTGASGTGKTHSAKKIASYYAKKHNVPAYFIQLSPDQTKTNVILGLRLINGSLVVQNGVVAECMERGGIIIIDEVTHATQSLILMLNIICAVSLYLPSKEYLSNSNEFSVICDTSCNISPFVICCMSLASPLHI